MHDHAVENTLIQFFEDVAQQQPELLAALEQQSIFKIEQGRWSFTLPDLHRFLQQQFKEIEQLDYTQFRSAVFDSAINHSVAKYNAKIIIANNCGKVDQSEYALVWQ